MTLRAMTIRQPWAQAVANGHKTVENRSRTHTYRGEIAIHSGKVPDLAGDTDPRILRLWGPDPRVGAPVGAILAVADLVDCHEASPSCTAGGSRCHPWGDLSYGVRTAWHYVLDEVHRLDTPVHCRGALQIGWTVPSDCEALVRAQLVEVSR